MGGRFAACLSAIALMLGTSCGGGQGGGYPSAGSVRIDAGEMTWVDVPAPSAALDSAPGGGMVLDLPTGPVTVRAGLLQGSGSTPASRAELLRTTGFPDAAVLSGSSRTSGVTVVGFTAGDTCRLERVWPRGGGELLALTVEGLSGTPQALLARTERMMERAAPVPWPGLRTPYLSDRSLDDIRADLYLQDSDRPPEVSHRITLEILPLEQAFVVVDTFMVDFQGTSGIDGMRLALPRIDGSAPDDITAIQGTYTRGADSVMCVPDPGTMVFSGVYGSRFDSYYREDRGFVTGQVRLASSFCCGEWFYPGAEIPSSYELTALVPRGGEFFCPLAPVDRSSSGSTGVFTFASQPGGIPGPLPWAAGNLEQTYVAGGRSRLVHIPLSESAADSAARRASLLAGMLWDRLGFEGARFDVVIVESVDRPVLAVGPGFLCLSPDRLALLDGCAMWDDTLSSGIRPEGPAVVANAARAFLAMSNHLPGYLSASLAAWSVYLFVDAGGSAEDAENILECFRRYYLASTSGMSGEEYAIADASLAGSALEEPVLMGKAPIVLAMFSRVMPGFEPGLRAALGRLRHPGAALLSLSSAVGLSGDPSMDSLFWDWMCMPGVPQLMVTWRESGGRVDFSVEQLQPGGDFPLPLGEIRFDYENGRTARGWIYGPSQDGGYWALHNSGNGRLSSIDVAPARFLPADIVYSRE